MGSQKLSALSALTAASADDADLLELVDVSVDANKKMTLLEAGSALGAGRILLPETVPSTPAAGVALFSRKRLAGIPAHVDPDGRVVAGMPFLGGGGSVSYVRIGGYGANTAIAEVNCVISAMGTASNVASTFATTNFRTQHPRARCRSSTSAGSSAGIRTMSSELMRSTNPGLGGFAVGCRFAPSLLPATWRWYAGHRELFTIVNADPSSFVNCVLFGQDAADIGGTIKLMHNDNSGTCTKVDTGLATPTGAEVYDIHISCPSGASTIYACIEEISSGAFFETDLTTDLPRTGTAGGFLCGVNNATTASEVNVDWMSFYCFRDF